MKHRERVWMALNHQQPDRCPMQVGFTPEFAARLRPQLGLEDGPDHNPHGGGNTYRLERALDEDMLLTSVGWANSYYQSDHDYVDEWGVGWTVVEYETRFGRGHYTEMTDHPLARDEAVASYRPPDPHRTELYRDAAWTLREFQHEYWIVGVTVTTIFETAWALRGYERLLTDLLTDPDLAAAILEIPFCYHLVAAQRLVEMGVDMIWVGDDVGSQAGMLISPELWRRLFKPQWAEFFATLKRLNPALKIAYHSDGVIDPIIPDFIEIGLDVLNPVQPACMDPARLKQQYGDRLSFWGTIDQQHTLPFGSPGDVTREVRARLETVGRDGGLIIGPTHHVQLDTPLENFGAMIHAITGHTLCLWFMILCSVLWAMGILPTAAACRAETPTIESPSLGIELDATTGLPARIETRWEHARRQWLTGPVRLTVRNEVTSSVAAVAPVAEGAWQRRAESVVGSSNLLGLPLQAVQQWSLRTNAIAWEMDFRGDAPRVAHEVIIELPLLSDDLKVFTPTERGVIDVAAYPTFQGLPYAAIGWETGQAWVLPLVSVFDPRSDQALTIALPADANIPHLRFDWLDGKKLRVSLAHRGMGGGQSSPLTLLLFAHAADYRGTLRAYSDAFPDYFHSPMPRGPYEGTFWYHHIQDHPAPEEMARQSVRYIWSSFWFTHLGEYLPDTQPWEPFTYAKWWKLAETMADEKIRTFVRTMHARGIGTYAYFNVTEYGGAGGKTGDSAEAARILREQFANALVKNARGDDIPTWEGAMAMNPGRRYSLWPFLEDQVRRHLTRLPEIDGFVIDRLDWASQFDYAHDDGLSMIGERPVENLAVPVSEAVQAVARLSHAADKRVFVNQFYRIEVLRDVDGVCHENDYLPALGYLTPLRPASAWHHRRPYTGDLLSFEAQLKQRLQWALFPQMIAHQFPISQQAPDPRAADFLELYAPLFDTLLGKEQVLLPHCVQVSGANDVNLFVNPAGQYVVPITSRTRFVSRPGSGAEAVDVILRVPDAQQIGWAHAISADGPSYSARVSIENGIAHVTADQHGTATMLVVGQGQEPALADHAEARRATVRESLLAKPSSAPSVTARPQPLPDGRLRLRLTGAHVGTAATMAVLINDVKAGHLAEHENRAVFDWTAPRPLECPPCVTLVAADEGTWFVPERLEVLAPQLHANAQRIAAWQLGMAVAPQSTATRLCLPLAWNVSDIPAATARWVEQDIQSAGHWKQRVGSRGVWIPGIVGDDTAQFGTRVEVLRGEVFRWPTPAGPDVRALEHPQQPDTQATCWFADDRLQVRVVPPDTQPYRLSLYLLDYDRNGRAVEIVLSDEFTALSTTQVSATESAGGVYVTWMASGPVHVELKKTAGYNVVLSGVFVDPATKSGE